MPGPFRVIARFHAVAVLIRAMKGAAQEFPKPCSAAPVMERKVHVPFRKSSFLLSRSRMRHSNQPSSSRVRRSTRREAPRVSDTRPVGGGERVGGQRAQGERQRKGDRYHTQPDRQSQQMQEEGLHEEDRHPMSQRPQSKS